MSPIKLRVCFALLGDCIDEDGSHTEIMYGVCLLKVQYLN